MISTHSCQLPREAFWETKKLVGIKQIWISKTVGCTSRISWESQAGALTKLGSQLFSSSPKDTSWKKEGSRTQGAVYPISIKASSPQRLSKTIHKEYLKSPVTIFMSGIKETNPERMRALLLSRNLENLKPMKTRFERYKIQMIVSGSSGIQTSTLQTRKETK